TRPDCTVVSATRWGKPVTGHFSGFGSLLIALLLAVLAYLVSWLATTRAVWLLRIIANKPGKWCDDLTRTDSFAAHCLTLAYLVFDTLLIRWIAGPVP